MIDDRLAEAGAFLLAVFGAFLLGMSPGFGMSAGAVGTAFQCGASTGVLNTTSACSEVIATLGDMALWSGIGGAIVFASGLVALGLIHRE